MEDITGKVRQRAVVIGFLIVCSFPRRTDGRTDLFAVDWLAGLKGP
jgi:hypothetical protein